MADVKNNSDNNVKDEDTKSTTTTAEEDEKKARDKILRKRTAATKKNDEVKAETPKKTTNDGKMATSSKVSSSSSSVSKNNEKKEGTPSERPRKPRTRDRQRGIRRGTGNRAGEVPGRLPPFPGRYPGPPHDGGGYYNDHGPSSRQYPPALYPRGGQAPGRERSMPPGRYPAPPHHGGGYYNDHGPASRLYPVALPPRGGIPPGRWERGMNGPMGFPARGPPRPPHHSYHSNHSRMPPSRRHRHVHHSRSPSSRRHSHNRSYHSDSSRSQSRSVSRGSSYSSEGSRSSYYSKDDDTSRSRSHSRSRSPSSRSPSPESIGNLVDDHKSKTEKKQQQDVEFDEDNDSKKKDGEDGENDGVERSSQTSKTSSSNKQRRLKRSRSRSEARFEEGVRNRRGRSRRRGRQSRNRADSRSSHTDRSLSQSSASSSRSFSSSSSVSMYSNSSISEYSSDERGGRGRRRRHSSRERERRRERKRRRRYHSRQGSRRDDRSSGENSTFSKDQRTVFVSQLVMRTVERDLRRYFKKKIGCKVNDVILIRDRQNSRNHKGCAYVEVGRIEDVAKAVAVSGIPPDWQKFPILVKASEAEKNYVLPSSETALVATTDSSEPTSAIAVTPNTTSAIGSKSMAASGNHNQLNVFKSTSSSYLSPLKDGNGKIIESQKVYIGNLDPAVSEDHLFALFSQFGTLEKVTLQVDPNTRISRGYAFLAFRDPKVSHLAIRTMAGKIVAGRSLKTGWANQSSARKDGCTIVTSDEFPDNAAALSEKALSVLAQMTRGGDGRPGSSTDNGAEQEQPKNAVPGVVDGDKTIDSTVHSATAVELSKAMMATSTSNLSANESALATLAEQELDKALGLVPTGGVSVNGAATSALAVPTVAEARASLAATVASQQLAASTVSRSAEITASSKLIGNSDKPSRHLLVHNMYDKDEETDEGWQKEIEEDFVEECSKFGKIESVTVMHMEPGGKIYASFADPNGAKACAENLAGRWFDKRQLRVDYIEGGPPLVK